MTKLSNYVQEIVFGANDGILTMFSFVASVSGSQDVKLGAAILVVGIANLLADATSMGMGSYIGTKSESDLYKSTKKHERKSITKSAAKELEEAYDILISEGYSNSDALMMAQITLKNPEYATDFMMHYEHGMCAEGSNPVASATATFLSFLTFGFVPFIPYLFTNAALIYSVGLSLVSFVALAALRHFVTGIKLIRSIVETVGIGILAGSIAYLVGILFQ